MSALSETLRGDGRVEGRTEGKLETVVKLVGAGMLTEKQAAGFLCLSVDEFRKKKAETEKKELVNMV